MSSFINRMNPKLRSPEDGISRSIARSGAAALVMGIVLFLLLPLLGSLIPASGKLEAIILTIAGVTLGTAIYLAAARALHSEEVGFAAWQVICGQFP